MVEESAFILGVHIHPLIRAHEEQSIIGRQRLGQRRAGNMRVVSRGSPAPWRRDALRGVSQRSPSASRKSTTGAAQAASFVSPH
jgi:hypothetical protein